MREKKTDSARWKFIGSLIVCMAGAASADCVAASSWPGPVEIEMNTAGSPVSDDQMAAALEYAAGAWSARTGLDINYVGTTDSAATLGRITLTWAELPFFKGSAVYLASTQPYSWPGTGERAKAVIRLSRWYFGDTLDDCDLETIVHEIGHALGIAGHSDNPSDVMYRSRGACRPELSGGDIALLPYEQYVCHAELRGMDLFLPAIENHRAWLVYAGVVSGFHKWILQDVELNPVESPCFDSYRLSDGRIKLGDVRSDAGRWAAELLPVDGGYALVAVTPR